MSDPWPTDPLTLEALQEHLAALRPHPWAPSPGTTVTYGGCFVCFARGGAGSGKAGDPGWSAATAMSGLRLLSSARVAGRAGAPYMPGLLAAREGALLAAAVQRLDPLPDVLLINATGRDHPRRAGLALHLGWALDLPTVGVTNRPLIARGAQPGPSAHSTSPLMIDDDQIGCWLRTRSGSRPVAVSPAWRMDLDTATAAVIAAAKQVRTVEPIRQARRLARTARAEADQAEATR